MTLALIAAVASTMYLFAGVFYFSAKLPKYDHIRDTISELGENGSPYQRAVNYGVFLPVGLLLCVVAVASYPDRAAPLAACLAAGYITSVFFPCDPGCPTSGSPSQVIHNLGGVVQYVGGATVLYHAGIEGGAFSGNFIAHPWIFVGLAALGIALPLLRGFRGLSQRIAEILLFVHLILLTLPKH